jgi:hypothetical protein
MTDLDVMNKWGVSLHPATNTITFLIPPSRVTPDEALVLAAWLVSMGEFLSKEKFSDILETIQGA